MVWQTLHGSNCGTQRCEIGWLQKNELTASTNPHSLMHFIQCIVESAKQPFVENFKFLNGVYKCEMLTGRNILTCSNSLLTRQKLKYASYYNLDRIYMPKVKFLVLAILVFLRTEWNFINSNVDWRYLRSL